MTTAPRRPLLTTLAILVFTLMPVMGMATQSTAASAAMEGASGSGASGTGAPVELASARTSNSKTYVNPDGSRQTQVYPAPIAFKDSTGAYQPIQNDLIHSTRSGYAVTNHANGYYQAFLPPDLSAPIHIDTPAGWVEYGLQGGHGSGSVSGNTDTYSLPTGSISYATGNLGVKESIVLSSAQAPASYSFSLKLSPGLTAQQNASGGIDILDGTGKTVFGFLAPSMEDSTHARSTAVTLTLSGSTMTVSADPTWLADPARRYPVTIDPTWSWYYWNLTGPQDCLLASNTTGNSCTYIDDGVGNNGSFLRRTLLQFTLSSVPANAIVQSADLALYQHEQDASSPAVPIGVYPVTRSWTRAATWQTYDGFNPWTTPGGDFGSTLDATATIPAANGWDHLYPTQLVQNWLNGTTPNNGMLLKEPSETVINTEYFYDTEYSDSTYWPTLSIVYDLPVGNPGWFTFDGSVNVASGNLMLGATDLAMPGVGLPLAFGRTYNSRNADLQTTDLGTGWSTSNDLFMILRPDGSRTFYGPGGFKVRFAPNGSGGWVSPPGIDADLVTNQGGSLTLTSRASGTTMLFASDGSLQEIEDASLNEVRYTYGQTSPYPVTTLTDSQGRTTSLAYNASNFVSTVTDPTGRIWRYGYDGNSNLTSVTDPASHVTQYGYDANHNLTSITDPNQNVTTIGYDTLHRVTSITAPINPSTGTHPTTTYTYNAGNTVVTDPRGKRTTYYYDTQYRVTSVIDPLSHTSGLTWNGDNRITQVTPPSGSANKTTYTYDSANRLTQVARPDGTSTSASYGSLATDWTKYLPTSTTDAQGNTTSYAYNDPSGTLASVTNPGGGSISCNGKTVSQCLSYNTNGTIASATDERGNATTYTYYQCSFTGSPACTSGQSAGLLQKVQPPAPLGSTSYAYDTSNRVSSVTDGNNHTSTTSYNADDQPLCVDYSGSGCVNSGEYYLYGYDANGNTTSVAQGTNGAQAISYYRFDALGQLASELQPSGTTTSCPNSITGNLCYTYDNAGNLLTKKDSAGTTTYAYNDDGSLYSVKDRLGKTSTFGYNQDGQLTAENFADSVIQALTYTNQNLTGIKATRNSTTYTNFGYSYVNPVTSKATNLVYQMTDASNNVMKYTYDSNNQLTGAVQTNGSSQLASYQYGHDPAGNTTSQSIQLGTNPAQSTTFTFNGAEQLTAARGAISKDYHYDATDEWTSATDPNNGNSTLISLAYNTEGQLASTTLAGEIQATGVTYNPIGQQTQTTNPTDTFSYGTSASGLEHIGHTNTQNHTSVADNSLTTLPDGGILSETITQNGSTQTYYPLTDANGSVVGLTYTDSSNVTHLVNQCSYSDPNGNPSTGTSCPTPTVENNFKFGGMLFDQRTGMYQQGNSMYDPAIGQTLGCKDSGWSDPGEDGGPFGSPCFHEDEAPYDDGIGFGVGLITPELSFPGWDWIRKAGQAGEETVSKIESLATHTKTFVWNGIARTPDIFNKARGVLIEVKNSAEESLTGQIKAYIEIAEHEKVRFILYVRRGTELSGSLERAVERAGGEIWEYTVGRPDIAPTPIILPTGGGHVPGEPLIG